MEVGNKIYGQYLQILREELIPAMGCTEPIAMAYAAAKARQVLGEMPDKIDIVISGNISKNVKSVVVPNTGGLKGITSAVAAGVTVGDADRQLEVLAGVREEDIHLIREFMDSCPMTVMKSQSPKLLDIDLRLYKGTDCVRLRIADYHTNIVLIEKNGDVLLRLDDASDDGGETDRSVLSVKGIVEFAECVRIDDVRELLERQIAYNTAISQEGLRGEYGASVGDDSYRVAFHCIFVNSFRVFGDDLAGLRDTGGIGECQILTCMNWGDGDGLQLSVPLFMQL